MRIPVWCKININHISIIFSRSCNLFPIPLQYKQLQSESIGRYDLPKNQKKTRILIAEFGKKNS